MGAMGQSGQPEYIISVFDTCRGRQGYEIVDEMELMQFVKEYATPALLNYLGLKGARAAVVARAEHNLLARITIRIYMAYHKLLAEASGMQRSAAQKKAHAMARKAIAIVNAMYEDSHGDADLDILAMKAIEREQEGADPVLWAINSPVAKWGG